MAIELGEIGKHVCDGTEMCYVPVQKMTVGIAYGVIKARVCECCKSNCRKCVIKSLLGKLEVSMTDKPIFDSEFNLLGIDGKPIDLSGGVKGSDGTQS